MFFLGPETVEENLRKYDNDNDNDDDNSNSNNSKKTGKQKQIKQYVFCKLLELDPKFLYLVQILRYSQNLIRGLQGPRKIKGN